jgi:hypothetical protein
MPPPKKRMIARAFQIVIQIAPPLAEVMAVVRDVTAILADVLPIISNFCRTCSIAPVLV